MKKLLALVLALVMVLSFAACDSKEQLEEPISESSEPEVEEPKYVTENANFKLDGIAVDDAYRDDDNSPIRMVYLFYTLTAGDTNIEIDSAYMELTINETNTYESNMYTACKFAHSYYHSKYLEDVYMGTSLKVVATFKIPEADLAPGRTITIDDYQIPGIEEIIFTTDEIQHYSGDEAVCAAMDPDGYAQEMYNREEADEETVKKVKKQIVGYTFTTWTSINTYELSFKKNGTYKLETQLGSTGGTYTITNGYILLINESTAAETWIPYTFEEGKFDMDAAAGFENF